MGDSVTTQARRKAVEEGLPDLLARLWRYALTISGEAQTAEDLVQSTCVRALERSDQFEVGTGLDRWAFRILWSIWINEVRSRKVRQGQGLVAAEDALVADLSQQVETNILAKQVLSQVGQLPEAQRTAVVLVYVEGFSYREAASILSVPQGTIMSRLAAARTKLSAFAKAQAEDISDVSTSRENAGDHI